MDAPLFRSAAIDARRRAPYSDRLRLSPAGLRLAAIVAVVVLIALGGFVTLAEVPRRATARGYLAPEGGLVRIHPPVMAQVSRLEVAEGDEIHEGQPLALIRELTGGAARREHLIRAPLAGRVAQLVIHHGSSVHPSRPLLTVIPRGAELQAILLVAPRDVGLIRRGQEVVLRIDAFPHRRYGTLAARVVEIAEGATLPGEIDSPVATTEAHYRVIAVLAAQGIGSGRRSEPLQPDLTFDADIVLERAPLITRLLEPLYDRSGATP